MDEIFENPITFPTVIWPNWNCTAGFIPGEHLPEESLGKLKAVIAFVFYGDKLALADITGRGMCVPSGHIEAGETIDEAVVRETLEETGAVLKPNQRRLIGCYRMVPLKSSNPEKDAYYNPVFVAEAIGFEPIPETSESRGVFFASIEDIADMYFIWDELLDAVFAYAGRQRRILFPSGTSINELLNAG